MNIDFHAFLTAFPALQSSPLILGLFNAGLIIYHILTHNRKPKAPESLTPEETHRRRTVQHALETRTQPKVFMPDGLFTPWDDKWCATQINLAKAHLSGNKSISDMPLYLKGISDAISDLESLVKAWPKHPKIDLIAENIFKLEQLFKAFNRSGVSSASTNKVTGKIA